MAVYFKNKIDGKVYECERETKTLKLQSDYYKGKTS